MGKMDLDKRILRLMDFIGWENCSTWMQRKALHSTEIPKFVQWMMKNSNFLPDVNQLGAWTPKQAFYDYFVQGHSYDESSFEQQVHKVKLIFYALYLKDKANGS